MEPCAFGSFASRQAFPERGIKRVRDFFGHPTDQRPFAPGSEQVVARHAKRIALAGAPQRLLDLANAVDGIGCNPGASLTIARAIIARARRGLVAKLAPEGTWAAAIRAESSVQVLGRYSARSMKAWPLVRHIGGEHADLAIRDLASRSCVLAPNNAAPRSPSRNNPAEAAPRSWVNKGRIRPFTSRSDDAQSSRVAIGHE
jgi:hypothetical protein